MSALGTALFFIKMLHYSHMQWIDNTVWLSCCVFIKQFYGWTTAAFIIIITWNIVDNMDIICCPYAYCYCINDGYTFIKLQYCIYLQHCQLIEGWTFLQNLCRKTWTVLFDLKQLLMPGAYEIHKISRFIVSTGFFDAVILYSTSLFQLCCYLSILKMGKSQIQKVPTREPVKNLDFLQITHVYVNPWMSLHTRQHGA